MIELVLFTMSIGPSGLDDPFAFVIALRLIQPFHSGIEAYMPAKIEMIGIVFQILLYRPYRASAPLSSRPESIAVSLRGFGEHVDSEPTMRWTDCGKTRLGCRGRFGLTTIGKHSRVLWKWEVTERHQLLS